MPSWFCAQLTIPAAP